MSLWVDTLRILLSDVRRSFGPGSEVKIQIRDRDGFWRDYSQSSGTPEGIQETLRATESATGRRARAVDAEGRLVDFR
jgi:hypothetical protein